MAFSTNPQNNQGADGFWKVIVALILIGILIWIIDSLYPEFFKDLFQSAATNINTF